MRIGDHQRVGAQVRDLGADAVELGARVFAGKAEIVQRHRAERRRRPVGPDRIDRIGLGRRSASRRRRCRPARASRRRPRCAATGRSRAWRRRRGSARASCRAASRQMLTMVNTVGSTCCARLQRVAAVDEQRRAVVQDHRGAGRAGEAGQPGEPLLARRHIFVLVAVGARQDEAGQPAPGQFGAQSLRPAARSAAGAGSSNDWKRASNITGGNLGAMDGSAAIALRKGGGWLPRRQCALQ